MPSRLTIVCLLAACLRLPSEAAGASRIIQLDPNGRDEILTETGFNTNLVAVGAWSKPVVDSQVNALRGRLVVYTEQRHSTNVMDSTGRFGKPGTANSGSNGAFAKVIWHATPVFLEIENLTPEGRPPTVIYLDVYSGIHFALRDANGAPADSLVPQGGGSRSVGRGFSGKGFWAKVPADGLLRWYANEGVASPEMNPGPKKYGRLNLFFESLRDRQWIIPARDTITYFLSATLTPTSLDPPPSSQNFWRKELEFPGVKLTAP